MNVSDAPKHSIRNREAVLGSQCGCYSCIRVFNGNDVRDWTDGRQTAICPNCGVDAVLPNETDLNFLKAACEMWFTKKAE